MYATMPPTDDPDNAVESPEPPDVVSSGGADTTPVPVVVATDGHEAHAFTSGITTQLHAQGSAGDAHYDRRRQSGGRPDPCRRRVASRGPSCMHVSMRR